jgi:hypothetical protein
LATIGRSDLYEVVTSFKLVRDYGDLKPRLIAHHKYGVEVFYLFISLQVIPIKCTYSQWLDYHSGGQMEVTENVVANELQCTRLIKGTKEKKEKRCE